MMSFAKQHRRMLLGVFVAALACYLAVRGFQWMQVGSLIAPFSTLQLVIAMPGAWLLGVTIDPLLWKLPRLINLVLFEVLIAAGFAANVVVLTLVLWHRRVAGRWWAEDPVIRKT